MKIDFYRENCINELSKLNISHQILFAASICERLLPMYLSIEFYERYNFKTFPILIKILNYIWLEPATGILNTESLENNLSECQQIITDMEEGELCVTEENKASYAIFYTLKLCAHAYLWEALNCRMEKEDELSGDNHWESKTFDEQYKIIKNHFYTTREIDKEIKDLNTLIDTPVLTIKFVEQFRQSSNPEGKGIIDPLIES